MLNLKIREKQVIDLVLPDGKVITLHHYRKAHQVQWSIGIQADPAIVITRRDYRPTDPKASQD